MGRMAKKFKIAENDEIERGYGWEARQSWAKEGKKRKLWKFLDILTHFDRGGHRDLFWGIKSTSCCGDLGPKTALRASSRSGSS